VLNAEFLARLAGATDSLRKNDIAGATRTIQTALGLKPASIPSDPPPRRSDIGQRPRRKLSDVVRIMQRLEVDPTRKLNLLAGAASKRIAPDPLPPGASFTQHSFSCAAGTRRYKLYRPRANEERAAALLVMLHGCTQNPDDFAVGTRMNHLAHEHGVMVVYPEQTSKDNQLKCWNWFNPGDQQRDRGEPAIIAGLTSKLIAKHNIDPRRVYVAGLSAGGAMAAILAATYPEIFAAVGVHSGLPHEAAYDVPSAFEAMRTGHSTHADAKSTISARSQPSRIIIFHADDDHTVHPVNGFNLFRQACENGKLALAEKHQGETNARSYKVQIASAAHGSARAELWAINGGGHAWSGGDGRGTYADPDGPCASQEMLRFFLESRTGLDAGKI